MVADFIFRERCATQFRIILTLAIGDILVECLGLAADPLHLLVVFHPILRISCRDTLVRSLALPGVSGGVGMRHKLHRHNKILFKLNILLYPITMEMSRENKIKKGLDIFS
jgi:hypothetical protein